MSDTILKVEGLSKQYRLGLIGSGTISHDLNRWWHRIRGKQDPFLKIGEANDRSSKGSSQYVWALRDINFEVKRGEVLGIIGKNGAGKSTLLKILSQVTSPTTGSIKSKGRIASLLEVGTGFHPEMTGKENIFLNGAILGMTKKEIKSKLNEIVEFSGCERYIDTPVKRYSSGMKVRLAFAVAAHLEPDILVVDEVLAVGDAEFQKKAIGKMKDISNADGRTVLFVSHDMTAIENLCDHSILLENGTLKSYGETNEIVRQYLSDSKESYVMDLKDHKHRKSSSTQVLEKITIGDGISNVYSGQNLNVFVDFDTSKIDDLSFGYVLKNEKNQILFAENSYQKENSMKVIKEKKQFEITFQNLALSPGSYSLSLYLGNGKLDIDIIEDAITFMVFWDTETDKKPPLKEFGSLYLETKWRY